MCESPSGGVTTRVPVPFTQAELGSVLHDVETSLIRSYSKVLTRRAMSPEKTALQFGGRLADVLMVGETRVLFEESRRLARQEGGRLRVLLETDGATVSQIPWEFAVDPRIKDDYLALRMSFARHLRVASPVPPLAVRPPLRVLGVHAHPTDRPALDVAAEQESVAALGSVSSDLVQVHVARRRPLERSVGRAERGRLAHPALHRARRVRRGHRLRLPRAVRRQRCRPARRCRPDRCRRRPDRDLRLVVLNACESATSGAGAFSSTAAKLMREGIPAVVAMQYEITDPAALAFAAGFYETLARGRPVDQAVTKGREIVRITQNSLEWATPVLFLASDEAHLFEVKAGQTEDSAWDTTLIEKLPKSAPPPEQSATRPSEGSAGAGTPERATDHSTPGAATPSGPGHRPALGHRTTGPLPADRAGAGRPGRHGLHRRQRPGLEPETKRVGVAVPVAPRHPAHAALVESLAAARRQRAGRRHRRGLGPREGGGAARAPSLDPRRRRTGVHRQRHLARRRRHGPFGAGVRHDRARCGAGCRSLPPTRCRPRGACTRQQVGPCVFATRRQAPRRRAEQRSRGADGREGQVVASWPHQQEVRALAVSSDRVVTGSTDDRLRFWDWGGRLVHKQEAVGVDHVAFSADGSVSGHHLGADSGSGTGPLTATRPCTTSTCGSATPRSRSASGAGSSASSAGAATAPPSSTPTAPTSSSSARPTRWTSRTTGCAPA